MIWAAIAKGRGENTAPDCSKPAMSDTAWVTLSSQHYRSFLILSSASHVGRDGNNHLSLRFSQ